MAEEISPLENHLWWMEQLRKDAKANRPEALRLADALESDAVSPIDLKAAAELRRLHAVNQELLEAAKLVIAWFEAEDDHSKADFYQRIEMCRTSEAALRAAIAKAEGQA